jgi:uncharacterized surface protein with fasciclin (FAS1) repeats
MDGACVGEREWRIMTERRRILGALPGALALGAFGGAASMPEARAAKPEDCLAILADHRRFSLWLLILQRAGMEAVLRLPGPWTMLAPTNRAIRSGPSFYQSGDQPADLHDPAELRRFAEAHLIAGREQPGHFMRHPGRYANLGGGTVVVTTEEGYSTTVAWNDGRRFVETNLTEMPIVASNGLIYPLEQVFALDK